jgi:hypothetical protein
VYFLRKAFSAALPIDQQKTTRGHFSVPVVLEDARPLGTGYD